METRKGHNNKPLVFLLVASWQWARIRGAAGELTLRPSSFLPSSLGSSLLTRNDRSRACLLRTISSEAKQNLLGALEALTAAQKGKAVINWSNKTALRKEANEEAEERTKHDTKTFFAMCMRPNHQTFNTELG